MKQFDQEERQIYAAFSEIEVDTARLAVRVRQGVGEKPTSALRVRRGGRLLVAALVLLLVSTVALAASTGGLDWFLEQFNPPFAEILEPSGAYAEDQGIRMTVIGAQEIGGMAVVYLSVQDMSGEGQLAQYMSFADGFFLGVRGDHIRYGFGMGQEMMYFDEITSTAYFALNFDIHAGDTFEGIQELKVDSLIFHADMFWDKPMELSLAGLSEMESMTLGWNYMMPSVFRSGDFEALPASMQILTPGNMDTLPHGDPRQWLSNMGIVDGQLRVQYGECYVERSKGVGPGDAHFALLSPAGEIVQPILGIPFLLDEENEPIRLDGYFGAVSDQSPTYRLVEFVFDIDLDRLPAYTLLYTGQGNVLKIYGDWRVPIDTSADGLEIVQWTEEIHANDMVIEFMSLSPLGLEARGWRLHGWIHQVEIALETPEGLVLLPWVGISSGSQHFSFSGQTDAPIDVSTVTAVVIDGHRIEMP